MVRAATLPCEEVLRGLGVCAAAGLSEEEAVQRRARFGLNAVSSHRARFFPVLWHQLRSPLLGLLLAAAIASFLVGQRSDAVIIGVIVGASVGLGLVNEYRAEKAAEALHSQIQHRTVAIRDGRPLPWTSPRWCQATWRSSTWEMSSRQISDCSRSPGWNATSRC
ncbi:cation-transporting P-type ATPase [Streptomyces goshikiensis]|uniref:cation-transporting P-type ATPase n=1 Tax=Streptomyces goshikiensis TaxID=1942 RepID=UPI0036F7A03E